MWWVVWRKVWDGLGMSPVSVESWAVRQNHDMVFMLKPAGFNVRHVLMFLTCSAHVWRLACSTMCVVHSKILQYFFPKAQEERDQQNLKVVSDASGAYSFCAYSFYFWPHIFHQNVTFGTPKFLRTLWSGSTFRPSSSFTITITDAIYHVMSLKNHTNFH